MPSLERYRAHAPLGTGTLGRVHRARGPGGTWVALKTLHPDLCETESARERFVQAARRARSLVHDDIVPILAVGQTAEPAAAYYTMALAPGHDLSVELAENELSIDAACEIGVLLCLALHAAHEQGVLHLDLKPQNVMISWNEHGTPGVQVMDFGLTAAVFLDDSVPGSARWAHASPQYLAPELILGAGGSVASDVYSVGALIYELLAGETPFDGDDEFDTMNAAASGAWVPLSERNARLPETLVRAVESALAAEPSDRPQSPLALVRQLLPHIASDSPVVGRARRVLSRAARSGDPDRSTLERAARPRRVSLIPSGRLLRPVFPKSPPAPQFETEEALGSLEPPPLSPVMVGWATAPPTAPAVHFRFDLLALVAGLGLGFVVALLHI